LLTGIAGESVGKHKHEPKTQINNPQRNTAEWYGMVWYCTFWKIVKMLDEHVSTGILPSATATAIKGVFSLIFANPSGTERGLKNTLIVKWISKNQYLHIEF